MITRIINNRINFGYSNILKTLYKQGKINPPDFYSGLPLEKDTVSLEHLKPHSQGGRTQLSNLVLTSAKNNNDRGNKNLIGFFNPENAKKYFDYFTNLIVPYTEKGKNKIFIGDTYSTQAKQTILRLLEQKK